jgi:hypothetical protein
LNACERFGEKLIQTVTQNLDNNPLAQGFGFYRKMYAAILETSVVLFNYGQPIFVNLLLDER